MLEDDGFCGDGDDVSHDNDDDGLSSFFGRKMLLAGVVFVHDDSYGLIAFCIIYLEREERRERERERERERVLFSCDGLVRD